MAKCKECGGGDQSSITKGRRSGEPLGWKPCICQKKGGDNGNGNNDDSQAAVPEVEEARLR